MLEKKKKGNPKLDEAVLNYQKEIRILHKQIESYQQSEQERVNIEVSKMKAVREIEQKFKSSASNRHYIFERVYRVAQHQTPSSSDSSMSSLEQDFYNLHAQNYKRKDRRSQGGDNMILIYDGAVERPLAGAETGPKRPEGSLKKSKTGSNGRLFSTLQKLLDRQRQNIHLVENSQERQRQTSSQAAKQSAKSNSVASRKEFHPPAKKKSHNHSVQVPNSQSLKQLEAATSVHQPAPKPAEGASVQKQRRLVKNEEPSFYQNYSQMIKNQRLSTQQQEPETQNSSKTTSKDPVPKRDESVRRLATESYQEQSPTA